ncbi:AraC family transcriptional regulator ligand-binding domain-containing protein [Spirosoma sp. BT702]|uniref:AraC family transcriptional regulator ligand-binding domain-containing protein n=1 Tax=Spirosoma profusum TaxID=2771354 RepID=A0A926Y1E8_9BACT|nr:AraC family transcriptional regulator [Spirosoma profusum]MBD2700205.1 AraC family transcriptional regulator ligand-binding domain-containing protein [Spirosoma profusum]
MDDFQVRFVGTLLSYAAQRDLSPEQLCQLSGIDWEGIKQRSGFIITPQQFNNLWLNASQLSNDALFGLHFGESLQLAALGIVGQIVQNSQTVGDALTQAADFIPLLTNLFDMDVSKSHDTFTVRFIPYLDRADEAPFALRQMLDLAMVFVLHEVNGLMLSKLKPEAIFLPYAAENELEYTRVLRCSPTQTDGTYSLTFAGHNWDVPILTANYDVQQFLVQQATALSNPVNAEPTLKERIGNYLITNAYLGIPTLEGMAANFNTSARSLQRKLQDEGVTYQQLADSIRKSLAMTYLESGKYPLKEISYLLGYNELSAFSRAFKRWTGAAPVTYRTFVMLTKEAS